MYSFQPKTYLIIREQLIKIGIDMDNIEHIDSLSFEEQEDIVDLFTLNVKDEISITL